MSKSHRSPEWSRFVRMARPIIKATLPAPCVNRCVLGGIVTAEQKWDVAHLPGRDARHGHAPTLEDVGPAHARCNRSDGGKVGARVRTERIRSRTRMPQW